MMTSIATINHGTPMSAFEAASVTVSPAVGVSTAGKLGFFMIGALITGFFPVDPVIKTFEPHDFVALFPAEYTVTIAVLFPFVLYAVATLFCAPENPSDPDQMYVYAPFPPVGYAVQVTAVFGTPTVGLAEQVTSR